LIYQELHEANFLRGRRQKPPPISFLIRTTIIHPNQEKKELLSKGEQMSTQNPPRTTLARWTTQRGLASLITFLIISVLIEYVVVLYAISLGVKENPENLLSLKIPGINGAIEISPLFHVVPTAVIVALATVWISFTKTVRPQKLRLRASSKQDKGSIRKEQNKPLINQRRVILKTSARSMLIVFLVFSALILAVSLLAYPDMIHQVVTNAYQNNPSLLNFVKGTGQSLASIGGAFSAVNGALIAVSPGLRSIALGLGGLIRPVSDLDNAGKYLFFQNAAVWISAIITLVYREYGWFSHRKR
jgi:predicted PurR-regulated permease PerM